MPDLSIDVSQLSGMYANSIFLVSNEYGVGVLTRGVLAAQAGDLVLSANGQLTLAGQTNASGNIAAYGRDGIANSGTTYAQQSVTANTTGALTNSGVLAAQQNTAVSAASVASTGTLGAGVNGDGTIASAGDLSVAATGAVTATGRNEGGGNTTIQGASVNLAGSNTSANGSLRLAASGGDLNLSNATTTAGGTLDTRASGTLTNDSGVLSSGGAQTVMAGALSNRNGQIVSGCVRNTSGRIGGGDVVVQAGRDVIDETQTYGVANAFGSNTLTGSVTGTGVDAIGTISATGSAAVIAGRDVNLNGARIRTGGDATVLAGRDVNVGTTTLTSTQDVDTHDGLNGGHTRLTQNLGSAIVTGGSLVAVSGRDTTLTNATVRAGGDASMVAGGNLLVTAAKDTNTHSEQSMGGKQAQHISSSDDEAVQGSTVSAGGNVTLAAGQNGSGNLAILGSTVATDAGGGGVRLISTGDVSIGSVSETHDATSWSHNEHSGFLSKERATDAAGSHQVMALGSTVSGDTVTGVAGLDMTISGSTVAATHDVALAAAGNVSITTSQNTQATSSYYQKHESGIGTGGGIGFSVGSRTQTDTANDAQVTNTGSSVGSLNGSLNITAGKNLHVTGSDLVAAQNVTGTGANVTIDSAVDTMHHDETHEVKQSGFTLAIKAPVIDAVSNTNKQAHAASRSQDDRAAALHCTARHGGGERRN